MFCSTWLYTCCHLQQPVRRLPAKAGRSRQLTPAGASTGGPRAHCPHIHCSFFCLHWESGTYPAAQLWEMLHKSRGLPPGELGMGKGIPAKCWGSPTRLERTQSMPATTSALSGVGTPIPLYAWISQPTAPWTLSLHLWLQFLISRKDLTWFKTFQVTMTRSPAWEPTILGPVVEMAVP